MATAKDGPRAAIRRFVAENSLKTPSVAPAQEMLDLMHHSRADQHKLIVGKLKARMMSRITSLAVEKQLDLLNKCFRYISIPELRDLPLMLFSLLPKIPSSYLVTLAQSPDLFAQLPLSVKRQVWSLDANSSLFAGHVASAATSYASQTRVRAVCSGLGSLPGNMRRARANNKPLQELVASIGDSAPLYAKAAGALTALYEDSPHKIALCSLRLQLPLAVLEAGHKASSDSDPALRLAQAVSAGLRGGEKEAPVWLNRAREAVEPLQGAGAVLSMLLRSPEAQGLVAATALAACRRVAEAEGIPKDDEVLRTATKLLCLAADESLSGKEHVAVPDPTRKGVKASEEDAACRDIMVEFYPAVACSLVDDMIREGSGPPEPLEEQLSSQAASHVPARRVLLQYACGAAGVGLGGSNLSVDAERALQLVEAYGDPCRGDTASADDARCWTLLSRRVVTVLRALTGDSPERGAVEALAAAVLRRARGAASLSPGLTTSLVLLLHAAGPGGGGGGLAGEAAGLSEAVSGLGGTECCACAGLTGAGVVGEAVRYIDETYGDAVRGMVALYEGLTKAKEEGEAGAGGASKGPGGGGAEAT